MTSPDRQNELAQISPNLQPADENQQSLGMTAVLGWSSDEVLNQGVELPLTLEQLELAHQIVTNMSEILGVNPNDVRFVIDESDFNDRRIVAVDSSPNGHHIGLYQRILEQRQANPDWYTLLIGNQRIDPLVASTKAVYSAMIEDARARGIKFLPDSLALNQHNGNVWTATMLTGEPQSTEGKIWIGSSSGGKKVNFVEHPINRGGKSFVVRPAVIIGRLGV